MSTSTPRLGIAMRSIGPVSLVSARRARNPTNLADRTCNFQQGFRGKNLQKQRWNVHSTWPIGGSSLLQEMGLLLRCRWVQSAVSCLSPGSRFWWLRGPAITEIDSPHLRGGYRLLIAEVHLLRARGFSDLIAWELCHRVQQRCHEERHGTAHGRRGTPPREMLLRTQWRCYRAPSRGTQRGTRARYSR